MSPRRSWTVAGRSCACEPRKIFAERWDTRKMRTSCLFAWIYAVPKVSHRGTVRARHEFDGLCMQAYITPFPIIGYNFAVADRHRRLAGVVWFVFSRANFQIIHFGIRAFVEVTHVIRFTLAR